MKKKVILGENSNGLRLDRALASLLGITRSAVKKQVCKETLSCNGHLANFSQIVRANDQLVFSYQEKTLPGKDPYIDLDLNILFEDEWVLVINKPSGLIVHPGAGEASQTLMDGLRSFDCDWGRFEDQERLGLVHRLDKDTTGVLVVAKTPDGLIHLQQQFKERVVKKEYLALVIDVIKEQSLDLTWPIGRNPRNGKRMAIHGRGARAAKTRILVKERFKDSCYLSAYPETGRTHQIRVHCHAMKHPVIGDKVYAGRFRGEKPGEPVRRPMLHSYQLTLQHPGNGSVVTWTAPLPEDMQNLLEFLRNR